MREEILKSTLFIKLGTRVGSVTAHYEHRSVASDPKLSQHRQLTLPIPTTEAPKLVITPRGMAIVTPLPTFNFTDAGYEVPRNICVHPIPIPEEEEDPIYEDIE